jgi:hypothetical protein
LKFEPSMLDGEEEEQFISTIDDIALITLVELEKDIVMQKKVRETQRGKTKLLQIGLKGQ